MYVCMCVSVQLYSFVISMYIYIYIYILNSQASMHPSHSVSWKMTVEMYKHQSCLFVSKVKKGKVHPKDIRSPIVGTQV